MPKKHRPRKGSLQFWPRKRARRIYTKIRSWAISNDAHLQGFAGYKVGMTHVLLTDSSGSHTKGMSKSIPVTIIECPPLKLASLRFYKKQNNELQLVGELYNPKVDKNLSRKIKQSKKSKNIPESFDELRAIVYTQPKLTGLNKKKPELFEIKLGNNDIEFAKSLLDKDIAINEVFKEGQNVDVHAVTKGKGFQGPIKRFGLKIKQHKSEKKKRAAGNLGPWTPKKVSHTVPQAGQMGFHSRMEHNKQILKIGKKEDWKDKKTGFPRYGLVKNDYIFLMGSVPGPVKRLIRLTDPIRNSNPSTSNIQFVKIN